MGLTVKSLPFLLIASNAFGFNSSDFCEIQRKSIYDVLNQSTLDIREKQRNTLRFLSPEIDQAKLSDLLTDLKNNNYPESLHKITDAELREFDKLRNQYEMEKEYGAYRETEPPKISEEEYEAAKNFNSIPGYLRYSKDYDEERKKYFEIDAKMQTLSMVRIARQLPAPLSEEDQEKLSKLTEKVMEHDKRNQRDYAAQQALNNYVTSQFSKKVKGHPEISAIKHVLRKDEIEFFYKKPSKELGYIEIRPQMLEEKAIQNKIGDKREDYLEGRRYSSHYIYGKSLPKYESKSLYVNGIGHEEYMESEIRHEGESKLKLSYPAVWSTKPQGEKHHELSKVFKELFDASEMAKTISKDKIADFGPYIVSELDMKTGKIDQKIAFTGHIGFPSMGAIPSEPVSIEEMTALLLPQSCKIDSEGRAVAVSDNERQDKKEGFFKRLFGGSQKSSSSADRK